MKKFQIAWTEQARTDLREIRKFIARDAPLTAKAYIARLRQDSKKRLSIAPQAGTIVVDAAGETLREIYFGSYRIIYRVRTKVEVITVYHSARLLRTDDLDRG